MIKRLIFDIDGTIIKNVSFIPAIESALKKYNIYSENNLILFNKIIKEYENAYNSYNINDYLYFINKILNTSFNENFIFSFFEELKNIIPPYDEALVEYFEYISQYYELVLLSNYFEVSQRNRLKNMGINKYFSEYYGEKIIKPNKEAFILSLKSHLPHECIMIGDDLNKDIIPALSLGLNTIYISNLSFSYEGIKVSNIKDITRNLIKNLE